MLFCLPIRSYPPRILPFTWFPGHISLLLVDLYTTRSILYLFFLLLLPPSRLPSPCAFFHSFFLPIYSSPFSSLSFFLLVCNFFFFKYPATPVIHNLSLFTALPLAYWKPLLYYTVTSNVVFCLLRLPVE